MTFLEIPKHLLPAKSSRSFRPLTPHRDWLRALSVSVDEQPASYPFRGPKTWRILRHEQSEFGE